MPHSETTRTGDAPVKTATTTGVQDHERPVPSSDERADRPDRADVLEHARRLAHIGG